MGQLDDIPEAVAGGPHWPGRNLVEPAIALGARGVRFGGSNYLRDSDALFRESCSRALEFDPDSARRGARAWARSADGRREWAMAAEAYDYAMAAMTALFQRQPLRLEKERRRARAKA